MNLAIQLLVSSCKTKNLTFTVTGVDRGPATYRGEPLYDGRPLGRHVAVDLNGLVEVDPIAEELVDGRAACPVTEVLLIAKSDARKQNTVVVASTAAAVLVLFAFAVLLVERRRRRRYAPRPFGFDSMMDKMKEVMFAEGDVDLVHPQELKRASIKLLEEIGQGEFGAVKKALFRPDAGGTSINRRSSASLSIEFIVAVKMLKGDPTSVEKGEFFREAAVTAQFHHDNGEGHCCS